MSADDAPVPEPDDGRVPPPEEIAWLFEGDDAPVPEPDDGRVPIPEEIAWLFEGDDDPVADEPYEPEPPPRVRQTGPSSGGDPDPEWPRAGRGPKWSRARDWGHPDGMAMLTATSAADLRAFLVRDLARRGVAVTQEVFDRYRAGYGWLADEWERGSPSAQASARTSAQAPPGGASGGTGVAATEPAERALGEVVGWGRDADPERGTEAVQARVASVRARMGWAGAGPLGRAVVDQFALALVHRDAASMGLAAATAGTGAGRASVRDPGGAPGSAPGAEGEPESTSGEGPGGGAPPGSDPYRPDPDGVQELLRRFATDVRSESGPPPLEDRAARAWRRRAARAEVGLKNAHRLVRHARKAGILPPPP